MKRHMRIATTWDGARVAPDEEAHVEVELSASGLVVRVEAPYAGDLPPAAAPGRTDRLWEHEVVEVFVGEWAGREARYLEVELGPHGHWLALGFASYRERVLEDVAVAFAATIDGSRWRGEARIERAEVARVLDAVGAINAYAIRGVGSARRWLAAIPAPSGVYAGPDFHRLEHFAALAAG